MNELHVVMAWLAGMGGDAGCAICNAINNAFDNAPTLGIGAVSAAAGAAASTAGRAMSDPIGTASDAASDMAGAAGTVAGGAARAAREARDSFNRNYERESSRTGSPGAPRRTISYDEAMKRLANEGGTLRYFPPPKEQE